MPRYPDFIRNIVNVKISKYLREKKLATNFIDEVKKQLVEAEDRYGFNSYSGDPEKLGEYLLSSDFKIVVDLFRSAGEKMLLRDILVEAREKYRGLGKVVEAIDRVLEKLEEKDDNGGG